MRVLIHVDLRSAVRAAHCADHAGEIRVDADVETAVPHALAQRLRNLQAIERNDAALVRLDPVERIVLGTLRHRENARRIGPQQDLRRDRAHQACAGEIMLQPVDVIVAVDDVGLGQQLLEQRNGGLDALDDEFAQAPAAAASCIRCATCPRR